MSRDTATITTSHRGTSMLIVRLFSPLDFLQTDTSDLQLGPPGKPHLQGPACFSHDLVHIFCRSVPSQYAAIQRALALLGAPDRDKPIILMTESLNFGALPLTLGAPGLKPTAFIAIGLNPILLTSKDHPPFGSGMLPDNSPEGRERNTAANQIQQTVTFAKAQEEFLAALSAVGVPAKNLSKVPFLLDSLYSLPDRFVQMCTPNVEYPRSDAPKTLRLAGGYPGQNSSTKNNWIKPDWWEDQIITNSDKKKVIFVCQGTVAMDFNQLVLPSIAMLDHPGLFSSDQKILLVISLGRPGMSLPLEGPSSLPNNCFVESYIPYDEILPHVDVFITTGGYGSFQRALLHGTPLIMAGMTEEKPESAARAEWAGVAVNLRTGYPSVEMLLDAVKEVLGNHSDGSRSRYKRRAVEIREEILRGGDPVEVVVECLEELAAAAAGKTAGEGV
ncbi:MGT family glycosyltransferase [Rhypophila decipiens]|uniref:MGT family glycosyltransferase n=1 Tax=Rhypophila decipiens TaxID=261697 RepID=A0AAN6YAB6_9PEZI|nr:MGT family glycosyltransferase [Rhypophila decipiens]